MKNYLRNLINLFYTVGLLFSCFWFYACASTPSLVDKKLRYYDPCPKVFCQERNNWVGKCKKEKEVVNFDKLYCFEYCSEKSIFGNCQKYEMDTVDPNSPEFRAMKFRLRIPEN